MKEKYIDGIHASYCKFTYKDIIEYQMRSKKKTVVAVHWWLKPFYLYAEGLHETT